MSDVNNSSQNEKAAKVRRKPERENVLTPTFAAARQPGPDRQQSHFSGGGLLQRQCSCGKHTIAGGVCEECQQKGDATSLNTLDDLSLNHPSDIQTARDNTTSFNLSHIPTQARFTANGQTVQPALTVNAPGDQYEQEADRVAESVMRVPAPPTPSTEFDSVSPSTVSRFPSISRIQTSDGNGTFQASPKVEARINQMQGNGQTLPAEEQDFFEERMGYDFSYVRVHTDANAVQASRDIQAKAFTVGNNIAFSEGTYRPGTDEGRRLLAHELTHVVQQNRATPAIQREWQGPNGEILSDEDYEMQFGSTSQIGWTQISNDPTSIPQIITSQPPTTTSQPPTTTSQSQTTANQSVQNLDYWQRWLIVLQASGPDFVNGLITGLIIFFGMAIAIGILTIVFPEFMATVAAALATTGGLVFTAFVVSLGISAVLTALWTEFRNADHTVRNAQTIAELERAGSSLGNIGGQAVAEIATALAGTAFVRRLLGMRPNIPRNVPGRPSASPSASRGGSTSTSASRGGSTSTPAPRRGSTTSAPTSGGGSTSTPAPRRGSTTSAPTSGGGSSSTRAPARRGGVTSTSASRGGSTSDLASLRSHPNAHTLERHGGNVTDSQLQTRARTGTAPDGHTSRMQPNAAQQAAGQPGDARAPKLSTAFNSDADALAAHNALKGQPLQDAIAAAPPGRTVVRVPATEVGPNIGRGYRRIGTARVQQGMQGPLQRVDGLHRAEGVYELNPNTGVWEPITIFPVE